MELVLSTEKELPRYDAYGRPFQRFEIGITYTVINKGNYLVCLLPGETEQIKPVMIKAVRFDD